MNTLKSGPSSESTESRLLGVTSGGGAVMLKKESKPSASKPVTGSATGAALESPQTVIH